VKNATERTTVLSCINNDGSNRLVPIMVWKSSKLCLKNIKILSEKYYTNKIVWMTTRIFTVFKGTTRYRHGLQSSNILLFVGNCDSHS
jgi:hypothetical protein